MALLLNHSPCLIELVPLVDKEGRSVSVLVTKGTYRLQPNRVLALDPDSEAIAHVDEFVGQPGQSELRVASDIVDFKPATDVVLLRPPGDLEQSPLRGRKISVEVGPVRFAGKPDKTWPFGPLRRDQEPRKRFAGTYDQNWAEERMPLLPKDFDPRHNQISPPGQIAPGYLSGAEHVRISNLYADHETVEFDLPGKVVLVSGNVLGRYFTEVAHLDTVLIWSDLPRVSLVWRHVIRPRQKNEEIVNVHVYLVRLQTARELYGKP